MPRRSSRTAWRTARTSSASSIASRGAASGPPLVRVASRPMPRVVMGLQFFPRGGSAHVARNLARNLPTVGWEPEIVSGSLSIPGRPGDAREFYRGLDVRPFDMTAALETADPMRAEWPMHPSYEDRPGAPDRGLRVARRRHLRASRPRVGARARGRGRGGGGRAPPAPPDPDQRRRGAGGAGRAGGRPPARDRAADARGDRGGPGPLGARAGVGRAAARVGGGLRAADRALGHPGRARRAAARRRAGEVRARRQRVRPPDLRAARGRPARGVAARPRRGAARMGAGRGGRVGVLRRRGRVRPGRCCSTSGATRRSSACRC